MLTPNITLQIVSSQKKIVCSLQTRSRALISDPTVARDRQSEGGSDLVFFFLLAPTNPSSSPSGSRRGSSSSSPAIRGYFSPWWDREISRREERLPAGGRGDDHASQARGAAAGPPDPVGPVLLRRARRLLAQPPHRLQVSLPSTCSRPISNSVRLAVNVTRRE